MSPLDSVIVIVGMACAGVLGFILGLMKSDFRFHDGWVAGIDYERQRRREEEDNGL